MMEFAAARWTPWSLVNVFLPATATGLSRDSVVNVTAIVALNKTDLTDRVGNIPPSLMHEVDRGLRRVLDL